MSTSRPQAYALASLTWDPDLLPPLEMDGYLVGREEVDFRFGGQAA